MFEQKFEIFLQEQRRTATGLRLERLNQDLTGEKKLFSAVLWPVFQTFEGFILEYELVTPTGVRIFIDAFHQLLIAGFESEGFVAHAENISRERFSFERMRARTLAMNGIKYIPFSWDELDKKPEACRRSVYELLGRFSSSSNKQLSMPERELLRYMLRLNRALRLQDACQILQCGPEACRQVLRKLLDKQLIQPIGNGTQRYHQYTLVEKYISYMQ